MIDKIEKKVIRLIQGDIPLDPRPFKVLAKRAGISEEEFVDQIVQLKDRGMIRRFGATLRHQEAGFSSNAMVAWLIPEDRIEQVGNIMASFREVSHCYHRRPQKDWKYNLYTMVHGESREECHNIAGRIAKKVEVEEYVLLFSEKEFKKTSMEYF